MEDKWMKNKTFEWGSGGPTPDDISLKFLPFFLEPIPNLSSVFYPNISNAETVKLISVKLHSLT